MALDVSRPPREGPPCQEQQQDTAQHASISFLDNQEYFVDLGEGRIAPVPLRRRRKTHLQRQDYNALVDYLGLSYNSEDLEGRFCHSVSPLPFVIKDAIRAILIQAGYSNGTLPNELTSSGENDFMPVLLNGASYSLPCAANWENKCDFCWNDEIPENTDDVTYFRRRTSSLRGSVNSCSPLGLERLSLSRCSFGSLEGEGMGGEESFREINDLMQEIRQLRFENKKLLEEKSRLQHQIANLDDTGNALSVDNEDLKKKHQSLQVDLEKCRSSENELKMMIKVSEDAKISMQSKWEAARKSNVVFEAQIAKFEEEVAVTKRELEVARLNEQNLTASLNRQNEILFALTEREREKEEQLGMRNSECKALQKEIEEMIEVNKTLLKEKTAIEAQLLNFQQETASTRTSPLQLITTENFVECEETAESTKDCPIVESLRFQYVAAMPRVISSVPFRQDGTISDVSLCCEMQDVISSGDNLPSPICGKQPNVRFFESPSMFWEPLTKFYHSEAVQTDILGSNLSINGPNVSMETCLAQVLAPGEQKGGSQCDEATSFLKSVYCALIMLRKLLEIINETVGETEGHAADNLASSAVNLEKISADAVEDRENLEQSTQKAPETSSDMLTCTVETATFRSGAHFLDGHHTRTVSADCVSDQINLELRALSAQIAKSQAVLSYLQSKGHQIPSGTCIDRHLRRQCYSEEEERHPEEGDSFWHFFDESGGRSLTHNKNYCSACKAYGKKSISMTASQKSSPSRRLRALAHSCPLLSGEAAVATRATQTEPEGPTKPSRSKSEEAGHDREITIKVTALDDDKGNSPGTINHSSPNEFEAHNLSPSCYNNTRSTSWQDDISPAASPDVSRHRSFSFVTAIRKGNTGITDVETDLPSSHSLELPANTVNKVSSDPYTISRPEAWHRNSASELREEYSHNDDYRFGNRSRDGLEPQFSANVPPATSHPIWGGRTQLSPTKMLPIPSYDDVMHSRTELHSARPIFGIPSTAHIITRSAAFDFDHQDEEDQVTADVAEAKMKTDRPAGKSREAKWRKVDAGKCVMPDLMETSETESARDNSVESDTAVTALRPPPPPGNDPAFPSLPDSFLRTLSLHKDTPGSNENLTQQEIESKFSSLSLAFKTDKFTLSKRLELLQHQRDVAEKNIDNEVKVLRDTLTALNQMCVDSQMRELIAKVQHHVDVVQQSTARMSSRAEVFGAVQQEERLNRAFEVMVMHVKNLERVYEKEHGELEETRRLLTETRSCPDDGSEASGDEAKMQRPVRALSGTTKADARGRLLSSTSTAVGPSSPTSPPRLSLQSSPPASMASQNQMRRRCSMPVGPVVSLVRPLASLPASPEAPSTMANNGKEGVPCCNENEPECNGGMSSKAETVPEVLKTCLVSDLYPVEETVPDQKCLDTADNTWNDPVDPSKSCASGGDDGFLLSDEAPQQSGETTVPSSGRSLVASFMRKTRFSLHLASVMDGWTLPKDGTSVFQVVRYAIGALLVVAALLCLLFTFIPGQAGACRVPRWSAEELLRITLEPYLSLSYTGKRPL